MLGFFLRSFVFGRVNSLSDTWEKRQNISRERNIKKTHCSVTYWKQYTSIRWGYDGVRVWVQLRQGGKKHNRYDGVDYKFKSVPAGVSTDVFFLYRALFLSLGRKETRLLYKTREKQTQGKADCDHTNARMREPARLRGQSPSENIR